LFSIFSFIALLLALLALLACVYYYKELDILKNWYSTPLQSYPSFQSDSDFMKKLDNLQELSLEDSITRSDNGIIDKYVIANPKLIKCDGMSTDPCYHKVYAPHYNYACEKFFLMEGKKLAQDSTISTKLITL